MARASKHTLYSCKRFHGESEMVKQSTVFHYEPNPCSPNSSGFTCNNEALPSGESEQLFLPLGYESGYDYPLLVWLPQSGDTHFDLGRTMMRMSLRNYLAVLPAVPSDSESCFQAIDGMMSRYCVHSRGVYIIGVGAGGENAFRYACQNPESFAGVVSINGRFPLRERLLGQFDRIRSLPMMLCCDEKTETGDLPNDCDVNQTLRLFHAAGGLMSMRVYRNKRSDGTQQVPLVDMVGDIDRWIMDEVCRVPGDQVTALV